MIKFLFVFILCSAYAEVPIRPEVNNVSHMAPREVSPNENQPNVMTDGEVVYLMNTQGQILSSWLFPNGFSCQTASQCFSHICLGKPDGTKVCDSRGITCSGASDSCTADCDCCSGKCSSSGMCVADGTRECIPNDGNYKASSIECCSRKGNSMGVCIPSQLSCQALDESCHTGNDCCSRRCNSRGRCQPSRPSQTLRPQIIETLTPVEAKR